MSLPEHGWSHSGKVGPGNNIVAQRRDSLTFENNSQSAEKIFEVGGDLMLVEFGPGERAAHGIDAGTAHQVLQELRGVDHLSESPESPKGKLQKNPRSEAKATVQPADSKTASKPRISRTTLINPKTGRGSWLSV